MKKQNIILISVISFLIIVIFVFLSLTKNKVTKIDNDSKTNQLQTVKQITKTQNLDKENTINTEPKWLTYEDNDLSFLYPETFLGTSQEEPFDKNLARDKWETAKEDNVIYIKPNFESPAAEFGSTYEINIFKDSNKAVEFQHSIIWNGSNKNLCTPQETPNIKNYNICKFTDKTDEGLGKTGIYYSITPKQEEEPWIFIFDASGNNYNDYITKLLSSLIVK